MVIEGLVCRRASLSSSAAFGSAGRTAGVIVALEIAGACRMSEGNTRCITLTPATDAPAARRAAWTADDASLSLARPFL
jgi:hypothetical protein